MPTLQDTVARRMIIAGTGAMVFGMVYGTQIHDETFGNSSAMLYGHGQLLLNGLHQLVGGMLLFFPQICKFNSSGALKLIEYGNVYAPTLVYCVDFWGAMNGVSWPRVRFSDVLSFAVHYLTLTTVDTEGPERGRIGTPREGRFQVQDLFHQSLYPRSSLPRHMGHDSVRVYYYKNQRQSGKQGEGRIEGFKRLESLHCVDPSACASHAYFCAGSDQSRHLPQK
ncbi:hypothetical protein T439DRAFT_152863 [Meredithblackwellia eburnea MCA 4105]